MISFFSRNKNTIIRFAFLIPIILVAIISISHVVSWYDLANPLSWAIYLSIAIEIAAMSAIAAASVKVKGFSVWFVFILVTLIQFIGNIFFSYLEINEASASFLAWVELTQPVFELMGSDIENIISQKRWLALLEGGMLPLISLTCLHFFIQYDKHSVENTPVIIKRESEKNFPILLNKVDEPKIEEPIVEEKIEEPKEEVKKPEKASGEKLSQTRIVVPPKQIKKSSLLNVKMRRVQKKKQEKNDNKTK